MAGKNSNKLIRVMQDDVEFFTVADTGESGMSVSGLAIFCGVSHQAISRLLKNLATKAPSRGLEKYIGQDIYLATSGHKRGGKVKIVKAAVCGAVVKHYAGLRKETADYSLDKFLEIGISGYIQDVTGWSPQQVDRQKALAGIILDDPQPWELHFDQDWRFHAVRLTGLRWEYSAMRHFINGTVYNYFPAEVRERLDVVNPVLGNGRRKNRQHQHFDPDSDKVLRSHIATVKTIMKLSDSIYDFRVHMQSVFNDERQLALLLTDRKNR